MARTVKVGLDVDEKPYVRGVERAERATERLDDAVGDLGTSAKATAAGMGKARDTIGEAGVKARTTASDFDQLGKSAAKAGRVGLSGLTDAVGALPRQLRGALILGVGAVAAAAAPMVGAALAGAIGGAVGSGAIAAGIAGAARSPQVKAAWADLASEAETALSSFSRPFIAPTVEALRIFRSMLADVRDDLAAMGVDAAGFVEPLARGLAGLARQTLPGLRSMMRDVRPVFEMLEDELPDIGNALDSFFESIGDGAEGGAQALRDLLELTEKVTVATGEALEFLGKHYQDFKSAADRAAGPLGDLAAVLLELFGDEGHTAKIKGRGTETRAAFDAISHSARNAADRVGELNQRFDDLFDKQMNLDQANVDFQLGLIGLGETLKDNNETIDDANERWLRNQDALLGMINEAKGVRDAAIEMGNGTEEASRQANAAYDAQLEQIRKLAASFGLPIDKINELVNAWKAANFEPKTARLVIIEERQGIVAGGPRGAIIAQAKGGIVAAQEGMIATSPTVLFGERETGVEAFIPQRGISRGRGMALGAEAMRWHQASVVPWEQMAGLVSAAASGRGGQLDEVALGRALRSALRGMSVQLDGHAVGRIEARRADLYARGG